MAKDKVHLEDDKYFNEGLKRANQWRKNQIKKAHRNKIDIKFTESFSLKPVTSSTNNY